MSHHMHEHPFERPFTSGDVALFNRLTSGLGGTNLTRWRETYADGLVFEFGELVPKTPLRPQSAARDRGEWVVSTWGCDVVLELPDGSKLDTSKKEFNVIKAEMPRLIGKQLDSVDLKPSDLTLELIFSEGTRLVFRTDLTDPELDQWYILTPTAKSIGASASGNWYLRTV